MIRVSDLVKTATGLIAALIVTGCHQAEVKQDDAVNSGEAAVQAQPEQQPAQEESMSDEEKTQETAQEEEKTQEMTQDEIDRMRAEEYIRMRERESRMKLIYGPPEMLDRPVFQDEDKSDQ